MTLPPALQNPFKPRPDEAERRARLASMKRVATGMLAMSGAVFLLAVAFEGRFPWLGYVRAMAEASLVGGLADWFAVTAIFRRPLGLPIPHTAIVARQKDRIGRVLGTFVENHFLSRDVIAARMRGMRPAARMAAWLSDPVNAQRLARQAAAGLGRAMDALPDDRMRPFVRDAVQSTVRDTPVAPLLGRALSALVAANRHQELVNRAIALAAQAVQDNRDLIREKVRAESPWWVPGRVDDKIYERIFASIDNLLRDISGRDDHPVRAAIDKAVMDFIWKLERSPETIVRMDELKNEWLDEPAIADLAGRIWGGLKRAVARQAALERDEAGALTRGIASFGDALLANEQLLAEIDDWLVVATVGIAEQNRREVADIIAQTIASWDPDATVERIELAVGRDLQFVRINGTLVGGIVGLVIYSFYQIWK